MRISIFWFALDLHEVFEQATIQNWRALAVSMITYIRQTGAAHYNVAYNIQCEYLISILGMTEKPMRTLVRKILKIISFFLLISLYFIIFFRQTPRSKSKDRSFAVVRIAKNWTRPWQVCEILNPVASKWIIIFMTHGTYNCRWSHVFHGVPYLLGIQVQRHVILSRIHPLLLVGEIIGLFNSSKPFSCCLLIFV